MAQQVLNQAEVGPPVQQMGGKGVPDLVGRQIHGQIRQGQVFLHDQLNLPHADPFFAIAQNHGIGPSGARGVFPPKFFQYKEGDLTQRTKAFLIALSPYPGHAVGNVDHAIIQAGQFADPQAGAVEQFQHQPVPPSQKWFQTLIFQ